MNCRRIYEASQNGTISMARPHRIRYLTVFDGVHWGGSCVAFVAAKRSASAVGSIRTILRKRLPCAIDGRWM